GSCVQGEPEAAEGAGHVQAMNNGATESAVINGFVTAPEYLNRLVSDDFHHLLHRELAPGEAAPFVAALRNGLTEDGLRSSILESPEFFNTHGGTPEGWVKGVYEDVLHRTPAAGEIENWANHLRSGRSRGFVANQIVNSHEAHEIEVNDAYRLLLGRDVDDSGRQTWAGLLDRGGHLRDLAEHLAESPEFEDHHTHGG